jgi:hypothetical protein
VQEERMTKYILIATLAFGTVACTRNQRADVREEASETRARVDDWQTERTDYSRRMQERLDRIDREMEEERVKAEGRQMSAKSRREYNERMDDLNKVKRETREQWNDAKSATKEGWNDFKRGMDNAADKLDNAWERFKADMKS